MHGGLTCVCICVCVPGHLSRVLVLAIGSSVLVVYDGADPPVQAGDAPVAAPVVPVCLRWIDFSNVYEPRVGWGPGAGDGHPAKKDGVLEGVLALARTFQAAVDAITRGDEGLLTAALAVPCTWL